MDKDNNDISNLQLLSRTEHAKLHGAMLTDERKRKMRENLDKNARPKASKWHGSKKGREWHREHYERMKEKLYQRQEYECKHCGKKFISIREGYCSNACKSDYRRNSGVDDVERTCVYCGNKFITNKYTKRTHCSKSCSARDRGKNADSKNKEYKEII